MQSFLNFVENSVAHNASDRTLRSAAASFADSLRMAQAEVPTVDNVSGWIAAMAISGLKPGSRRKYIGAINSLYRDWAIDNDAENPFEEAKRIPISEAEDSVDRVSENLRMVDRLLKVSTTSSDFEAVALFLYLLYNPVASLRDIILLKFSDGIPSVPQIEDIIEAMRSMSRRRYVFPLDQGKKREGQIVRDTLHLLSTTLSAYGFDFGGEFSRDSIAALWIAAALKAGVSLVEIRAAIGSIPKEYAHLSMIQHGQLTEGERLRILSRVADQINDGASRWFVMRLRHGVTPDDISEAVEMLLPELHKEMALYYPTHTVVSLDKKGKRVKEEKPYLPGVLFFRLRKDKVATLFSCIGDMAWCDRWTNAPDSPYCAIPTYEMRAFQRHVGAFSPDIRMELVTRDEPLAVNQTVRINGGGLMENRIGVIRSIRNNNGTRTYTLALSEREFATWTVKDIEEVFIEPVNP